MPLLESNAVISLAKLTCHGTFRAGFAETNVNARGLGIGANTLHCDLCGGFGGVVRLQSLRRGLIANACARAKAKDSGTVRKRQVEPKRVETVYQPHVGIVVHA